MLHLRHFAENVFHMVHVRQHILATNKIHIPKTILAANHQVLDLLCFWANSVHNRAIAYRGMVALVRQVTEFAAVGANTTVVAFI